MAGPLMLPEEFALLSLADTGKVIDSGQAKTGCALAELGELALRGKLLVRPRKFKMFGLDAYNPPASEIQLIDATPVGLVWADELLAELAHTGGPLAAHNWLRRRRRRNAFLWHRDALVTRGLIRHAPGSGRFRRERYHPDPTMRNRLINEVRLAVGILLATGGGRQLDAHMLFLSDMVLNSELNRDLGIPRLTIRRGLDRARGTGAVASVPKQLRDTSEVLAALVPKRSRGQD